LSFLTNLRTSPQDQI